jgi:NAD(P)-dependent dehydrogenase (short-subunit alcohol dehydrogenase family)
MNMRPDGKVVFISGGGGGIGHAAVLAFAAAGARVAAWDLDAARAGRTAQAVCDAGGGAIVNMASGAALRGASPYHVYTATKGAILSLTHALAGTYAKHNIRATVIASGRVMTDRIVRQWGRPDVQSEGRNPQDPVGRLREFPFWVGEPEHVTATAVFLASDAARMITGATIAADGGRSAY